MRIGKRKVAAGLGLAIIAAVGLLGWWLGGTDGLLAVTLAVVSLVGAGLGWEVARAERNIRRTIDDLRRSQSASVREQVKFYAERTERAVGAAGYSGEQAEQLLKAVRGGFLRLDSEWQEAREAMLAALEEQLGAIRRDVAITGREAAVASRELQASTQKVDAAAKQIEDLEQNRVLFRQLEALVALYSDLRPEIGLPPTRFWAASPDLLRTLHDLVRERRPRLVVECGSGVSTLVMAYAMKKVGAGRVVALEHSETFRAQTEHLLGQHGVERFAKILYAPLRNTDVDGSTFSWYSTDDLPTEVIDILVVDGPPASVGKLARYPAVPLLGDQLTPGGIVVLDDHARSDEMELVQQWRGQRPDWSVRVVGHEKGTALLEKGHATGAQNSPDLATTVLGSHPSHVTVRDVS